MKVLAANGDFYIGLKRECTWDDGITCPATVTDWASIPSYAGDWWASNTVGVPGQCVAQSPTGWITDASCTTPMKYLCEKVPECLEPTYTATGCDWINPQGSVIKIKPDKVRHILDSPCTVTITRTIGTDSYLPVLWNIGATPNCGTKEWDLVDEGELA